MKDNSEQLLHALLCSGYANLSSHCFIPCHIKPKNDMEQFSQNSVLYLLTNNRWNLARLYPYYPQHNKYTLEILGSGYPNSFSLLLSILDCATSCLPNPNLPKCVPSILGNCCLFVVLHIAPLLYVKP